jgi:hypothetical protein
MLSQHSFYALASDTAGIPENANDIGYTLPVQLFWRKLPRGRGLQRTNERLVSLKFSQGHSLHRPVPPTSEPLRCRNPLMVHVSVARIVP